MRLLVTGAAGFIGSSFVRQFARQYDIAVIDKVTYAGNRANLEDAPHRFYHADILESGPIVAGEKPDAIVHFAAESHVDRSIVAPDAFIETNVKGTFALLEAARACKVARFVHVSTDEVYGSLQPPREATEDYPLDPSSPYSASKAASDLLAISYFRTYRLPVMVTRASNNYGPYQFPEKLIPLMVKQALHDQPLPVYGDGLNVRDWLYMEDHCRAVQTVLEKGCEGEIYNVGGACSVANIEVVRRILHLTGKPESLIQFVTDRPGHDRRYALSSEKIHRELGWTAQVTFQQGLADTIRWYASRA